MLQSLRYSQWVLRATLAIVFLWFGIDKFIHPDYWVNAWMPEYIINLVESMGLTAAQTMTLLGIFEVLVGVSLITGIFIKVFSVLAFSLLLTIFFIFGIGGFNEVLARDVGLMGGLLALIFWPRRSI